MKELPVLSELKKKIDSAGLNAPNIKFESYRKFLQLISIYPEKYLVPTKAIDEIWHLHIQDYKLYTGDCLNYFGFVANHTVIENQLEINSHKNNFEQTKKLWQQCFEAELDSSSQMAFCGFAGDGGDDVGSGNDDSSNDD